MLDVVHTAKIEQSSCVVEEIWELIGSNLFFSCLAAFFSLKETCVAPVFLLFTLREAGFSKPCMDRHLLLIYWRTHVAFYLPLSTKILS